MSLSEFTRRTVAYNPDAVPVPFDANIQELMRQTGITLSIATGFSLLLFFLALPVAAAPIPLLWALANGAALFVWWQLREDTALYCLGTHNQLRSMTFLSRLAAFYRISVQIALYVAVALAGLIAIFVLIAVSGGVLGVLAAMLGGSRR